MKVVLNRTSCPKEIFINQISRHHIFLSRHNGDLLILSSISYNIGPYKWMSVSKQFTLGNGYFSRVSVKKAVTDAIQRFGEVHTFANWQDAFKWALSI